MKFAKKKILSKILAGQLAFCMLFAAFASSALPVLAALPAQEAQGEKPTFNYVALGASNVNGYGLHGYNFEYVYEAPFEKAKDNRYGYEMDTPGSYTTLIRDALSEKYNVNLAQIATSSLRSEELHFLLDFDYWGDSYTDTWFYDTNGDGVSSNWYYGAAVYEWQNRAEAGYEGYDRTPTAEELLWNLRDACREKVANADLITVDVGMNNFGTYMLNLIAGGIFSNDLNAVDPEFDRYYDLARDYVLEKINEVIGDAELPGDTIIRFADTLAYALVGYCVNFDGMMEEIYSLNPDVKVVVVTIQNMMTGLDVVFPGSDVRIPFGEIFGFIVNAANAYTAALSPYSVRYNYADVSENGHVEFFMDEIGAYNGDPSTLSTNMKDSFDAYDDNLYLKTRVQQRYAVLMAEEGFVNLHSSQADISDTNSLYLFHYGYHYDIEGGVDTPVITLSDGTPLKEFIKKGEAGELSGEYKSAYDVYAKMLATAYDVTAEVMREGSKAKIMDFSLIPVLSLIDVSAIGIILDLLDSSLEAAVADPEYEFDVEKEYPDGFFETLAEVYGIPVDYFDTMFAFAMRMQFGGTVFSHPNANGYVDIKNAILSSLENDTYGIEFVVKKTVESAVRLTAEYLENVHESAYEFCDKAGYVDLAASAADDAVLEIKALKDAVREKNFAPEFENAVLAELDAATETLNKIRVLLENDDMATVSGLFETLDGLCDELRIHVSNAANILSVVCSDLAAYLTDKWEKEWSVQLEAFATRLAYALEERITALVTELVGEYGYLVEIVAEAAAKYAEKYLATLTPEKIEEIKAAVYEFIVEHKEEAIRFILENGVYALKFLDEHPEIIALSVGILAILFADDAVELIKLHEAEIKKFVIYLVNEYGDEALELVKKKLVELGVYEKISNQVELLYKTVSSAEYTASGESFYIALGDTPELTDSYAQLVAEALGIDYSVIYDEGTSKEESLALFLENSDLLADADLVTVSYSFRTVIDKFIRLLSSDEALDWAAYIGEDGKKSVESALSALRANIAESDLGEESADLVTALAEKLLYAVTCRFAAYPELVSEISKLAPNAVIAVLSYYNELSSLSITLYGREIKLGEYMNYAAELADIEVFITALSNENVIYVPIMGTETELDAMIKEDAELDSLAGYVTAIVGGQLTPSADGHKFISEKILDALDVTFAEEEGCRHEYGAVCDEYCDLCGEKRAAEPHSYYNACDKDCNVCGYERQTEAHVYGAACDADCDICGSVREPAPHDFGEWINAKAPTLTVGGRRCRTCAACGFTEYEDTPPLKLAPVAEKDGGLSGGAIAAIAVISVLVLAIGGFAVVWFGIKKKSFYDISVAFSKIFAKKNKPAK